MLATVLPRFLLLVAAVGTLLLTGCDLLEFSPNDTRVTEETQDLTQKNLLRLATQPKPTQGDTLRFVFTTDTQRYYDDIDPLVASINQQRGISLVLIGGDISDFGLSRELQWTAEKLNKLDAPYFTVVGNHDLVANGRAAYQKVFGPLNYAFTYDSTRFVLIDTNSREYAFNGHVPDVPWLQQQLAPAPGIRRQVAISHVPPTDGDFDPALMAPYTNALAQAPQLAFHLSGHTDKFGVSYSHEGRVTYISGYSVNKREYIVLTLWGDKQYHLQSVKY